jgi:hypothetical protein
MERNWETQLDPSVESFAEETWLPQPPRSPSFSVLGAMRNMLEEDLEMDTPPSATGIIVGAGLSVMLWCLITLVIIGVSTFVNSMLAV